MFHQDVSSDDPEIRRSFFDIGRDVGRFYEKEREPSGAVFEDELTAARRIVRKAPADLLEKIYRDFRDAPLCERKSDLWGIVHLTSPDFWYSALFSASAGAKRSLSQRNRP